MKPKKEFELPIVKCLTANPEVPGSAPTQYTSIHEMFRFDINLLNYKQSQNGYSSSDDLKSVSVERVVRGVVL